MRLSNAMELMADDGEKRLIVVVSPFAIASPNHDGGYSMAFR